MKSWKVRLLALFTVMALLASIAGPVMADDWDDCRRFHGDLYCEVDRGDYRFYNDFDDTFIFYPYFYYFPYYYYNDCGYDWDGPVTPYDCFD